MSVQRAHLAAAVLLVALAGCRYQPSTIPLHGSSADIARLKGSWDGEYSSVESGRTGSITFTIHAGKDTAFGDVVMTPSHEHPLIAADGYDRIHREHGSSPEWLKVTFVHIDGGLIRGELEPYVAPDCKCTVTTVFRGALSGDVIEGTYLTRGEYNLQQEGRWRVERRPRLVSDK